MATNSLNRGKVATTSMVDTLPTMPKLPHPHLLLPLTRLLTKIQTGGESTIIPKNGVNGLYEG